MVFLTTLHFRRAVAVVLAQVCLSSAGCECGYRITRSDNTPLQSTTLLYTDAVETNFREIHNLSQFQDWKIKFVRFNYVPDSGRFGKRVEATNIVPNPVRDVGAGWNGPSTQGANVDAGLQLIVRSTLSKDQEVSTGQIQSTREDVRFGSFRAYMRTAPINGTCAAHFWYHNDSQEIDVELLSRQQEGDSNPVNLSVHSNESVAKDDGAKITTGYIESQLGFDPADGFHEYRYDWSPDAISFYTDGRWAGDVTDFVPTSPGYFQLSHWSNGYPGWSAGPPSQDSVLTVAYYMAYFNSTDPTRIRAFESQCSSNSQTGTVCNVPAFTASAAAAQGPAFVS